MLQSGSVVYTLLELQNGALAAGTFGSVQLYQGTTLRRTLRVLVL